MPRLIFLLSLGLSLAHGAWARDKWIYARSEHFEMFSCVPEKESRELLGSLEQFRATVLSIYSLPRLRDPRTTVIVFKSDGQFKPYKPLYQGKPTDIAGDCLTWSDETIIALAADNGFDVTNEVVFHEYTHSLLASGGETPPLWLNEGLAELFSTFAINGDSYELGRAKPNHVGMLNRVPLMPLGELFAVNHQSPSYNEGVRQGIFYAESWGLVHFMLFGEDRATYMPMMRRFDVLLSERDHPTDRSFRETFGMSYADMETKLHHYLREGEYFFRSAKLPLGDLSSQIKFRPADDFERDVALANLSLRIRGDKAAMYQITQLSDSHPESPRPHEVLAAMAAKEGDSGGAIVHWRRAADLGSDNAYIYLRLAKERLDQIMTGLSLDYRMPDEPAAQLRGWLDRAVALSPNYLEAYEALADIEALAEKPRFDVVNRVQSVVPRMKDKSRTLLAMAIIRWRRKDYPTARKITGLLIDSPQVSPAVRSLAKQLDARAAEAAEPPAVSTTANTEEPQTAK